MSRCFKNTFYLREDRSVQTSSKKRKLEGDKLSQEREKCRLLFYPLTLSHLLLHASAYLPHCGLTMSLDVQETPQ